MNQQELEFLLELFPDLDKSLVKNLSNLSLEEALEFCTKEPRKQSEFQILIPKNKRIELNVRLDFQVEKLMEIFPNFSIETLESILSQQDGNLEKASEKLVELSMKYEPKQMEFDKDLLCLIEMFPSLNTQTIATHLRESTFEDVVDKLIEIDSKPLDYANLSKKTVTTLQYKFNTCDNTEKAIATNFNTCDNTEKAIATPLKLLGSGDPTELREEAQKCLLERNYYFDKAVTEFRKKTFTGRSSASYYSKLGHKMNEKMKSLNKEAADLVFDSNLKKCNNANTVDLHGLTIEEAKFHLLNYVEKWKLLKIREKELKVITGAGNHSKGNGKLYKNMSELVVNLGWKYRDGGNGWFFIKPT
jgi:hypothetical protein